MVVDNIDHGIVLFEPLEMGVQPDEQSTDRCLTAFPSRAMGLSWSLRVAER